MVNYSGKESSYGLCRARLVGSKSPGYTLKRISWEQECGFE